MGQALGTYNQGALSISEISTLFKPCSFISRIQVRMSQIDLHTYRFIAHIILFPNYQSVIANPAD